MRGTRRRAGSPLPSPARRRFRTDTERLDTGVFRTRLPEGPVVVSECMDTVRSVAVGLWLRQGSVHEDPAERGISHLLEHMVFKGTQRRTARELAQEIERVGGGMDAYTGHESTAYQVRVPDGHLELALDVLSDLAFHPLLRESDLELERQVVLEELAGIQESPEEVAFERYNSDLFEDHPYGARVAGSPETVGQVERASLVGLHELAYRGPNTIVAAAGRLDHEELVEAVASLIPRCDATPRSGTLEPLSHAGYRKVEWPGGRQAHVVAGATTVSHSSALRYALVLVDAALGAGMSSRLFQRVREERGLAYSVYSFASFYAVGGHSGAYLSTSPGRAEEARGTLLEELRCVAEEGLEPAEIDAMKEQLEGQVMLALESPSARMNRLAAVELYGECYHSLDQIAAKIQGVEEEAVHEACGLLHPDRLTVVELVPTCGG